MGTTKCTVSLMKYRDATGNMTLINDVPAIMKGITVTVAKPFKAQMELWIENNSAGAQGYRLQIFVDGVEKLNEFMAVKVLETKSQKLEFDL